MLRMCISWCADSMTLRNAWCNNEDTQNCIGHKMVQESQKYSNLFSIWNQLTARIYFPITQYTIIPCLLAVNVKSGSMVTTG